MFGGRGEPVAFDIVKDSRGVKTAIHPATIIYPENNLRKSNLKADKILKSFQKKKQLKQKINIVFESLKEKQERCRFYGSNPTDGIPKEFFYNVKKMIRETKGFYTFIDFQEHRDSFSVTVDEKSLAYLIFRSPSLNVKDIFLL